MATMAFKRRSNDYQLWCLTSFLSERMHLVEEQIALSQKVLR